MRCKIGPSWIPGNEACGSSYYAANSLCGTIIRAKSCTTTPINGIGAGPGESIMAMVELILAVVALVLSCPSNDALRKQQRCQIHHSMRNNDVGH